MAKVPSWTPRPTGCTGSTCWPGRVLTLDPASGDVTSRQVGTVAAALRPRARGGLVLALERRFALLDDDAEHPVLLDKLWDDPTIRFNDGGCDRAGRFYCGSMSYAEGDL